MRSRTSSSLRGSAHATTAPLSAAAARTPIAAVNPSSVLLPPVPPVAIETVCSVMATSAVPNDEPTCCMMRESMVAWGICSGASPT